RRQKIRLVRRNDVPARITVRRISHDPIVSRKIRWTGRRRPASASGVTTRLSYAVLRKGLLQRCHSFGCNRPCIGAAALDRIATHSINVVEQRLAVARGNVEDRSVRGQLIGDRLGEVPFLGLNRKW